MVSRNSAFGLKCSFERQQDQWDQVASPGPMQMTQPAAPIGQVDGSVIVEYQSGILAPADHRHEAAIDVPRASELLFMQRRAARDYYLGSALRLPALLFG